MLRKYNKALTVALTAIALATASFATTSDAFAGGGGKGGGGWGHHHHGFGGSMSTAAEPAGVGAWRPGQHLLLILRLDEHPPDVFAFGRVFYTNMADKRGSYASLFSVTEPESLDGNAV